MIDCKLPQGIHLQRQYLPPQVGPLVLGCQVQRDLCKIGTVCRRQRKPIRFRQLERRVPGGTVNVLRKVRTQNRDAVTILQVPAQSLPLLKAASPAGEPGHIPEAPAPQPKIERRHPKIAQTLPNRATGYRQGSVNLTVFQQFCEEHRHHQTNRLRADFALHRQHSRNSGFCQLCCQRTRGRRHKIPPSAFTGGEDDQSGRAGEFRDLLRQVPCFYPGRITVVVLQKQNRLLAFGKGTVTDQINNIHALPDLRHQVLQGHRKHLWIDSIGSPQYYWTKRAECLGRPRNFSCEIDGVQPALRFDVSRSGNGDQSLQLLAFRGPTRHPPV